jgi:hypothetical protein
MSRGRVKAGAAALCIAWSAAAPAATVPPAAKAAKKEAGVVEIAPVPPEGDADRDRTEHMQTALREILAESALRRTRVGIRVVEARTGRLIFEKRGTTLMDPASNQKVLATTTALVRLGADWRFRTEVTGPEPDADDTGEAPQRISPRAPLVVNHGLMSIRVRPGASTGWPAEVSTAPSGESFVIHNLARTKVGGKTRVSVRLSLAGARISVEIAGKIGLGHPALVFRRRVPQQALYSAVLLRAALESAC